MYNLVTNTMIFQSSVLRAWALEKVGIRIIHDDSSSSFLSPDYRILCPHSDGSRFSSISGDSVFSDMVMCRVEK